MKGNYNFRIERKHHVDFIGTDYAMECNKWIYGIRSAIETSGERNRTTSGVLKRNVDDIVKMFHLQ